MRLTKISQNPFKIITLFKVTNYTKASCDTICKMPLVCHQRW